MNSWFKNAKGDKLMCRIDVIRKRRGLSYAELARKTGLTTAYIRFLAKGERKNPSLSVMQKIAEALGEPLSSVFK